MMFAIKLLQKAPWMVKQNKKHALLFQLPVK
jgi:hypothetical protein